MAYRGQPIVDYIAGLIPLYQPEEVLGFRAARSLQDGTLILPHPENEGGLQDAMVVVWWQGDSNRVTDVLGSIMATNAVGDYARFHSFGKEEGHSAALLAQQYDHFEVKTGDTLYLPYFDDEMPLLIKIFRLAKSMGPKLALDILRRIVGL